MKLLDAPVIVKRFYADEPWIIAAAAETRRRFATPPHLNEQGTDQTEFDLKQLAEDIWGIDKPLGLHVDKTRRGFRVLGLVLVNDPEFMLVQGDFLYPLPVGTVYHIDGRAAHGAVARGPAPVTNFKPSAGAWIFGFMAWDVHRNEDLDELVDSIPEAMAAYAAGEKRIDVSTAARPL